MKQVMSKGNILGVVSICILSFCLMSCGTSYSVKQSLGHEVSIGSTVYVMADCISRDSSATEETCKILQEQVRYGLFKHGLYESNENPARHEVYLTITYYRNVGAGTRAWFGVFSGKDGIDVEIKIIDRQSKSSVGSAKISYYNFTAVNSTEIMMIYQVRKKIIEFLVAGELN